MNEFTENVNAENSEPEMQQFFDSDEEIAEEPAGTAVSEADETSPPPVEPEPAEETAPESEDGGQTDAEPPSDPLADDIAERHGQTLERLDELTAAVQALTVQMSAANKAITVHEEIERNLNNELQRYKNDFYDKLASPFLMQFIGLYIDMSEELDELRAESEEKPDNEFLAAYIKSLEYYADSVRGVLTNNSVEIKTPAVGDKYDYLEHRISKTVPAEDEALRDCIAAVKSSAFVYNGKVLRPAKVAVYKVK